ncbi:PREDICTED: uncharacterized protein LOC104598690 [Nelumbo nucifera]|uniref:Uncharacterized protein LOC104598690 n=1 Tax=Nelumbo nucifera TaxID=4432 RepID=A0A1U8A307_NELNU|nr:PREDICTED: uncharacterized protein LOC104598690 [Nelumbo nucifera]
MVLNVSLSNYTVVENDAKPIVDLLSVDHHSAFGTTSVQWLSYKRASEVVFIFRFGRRQRCKRIPKWVPYHFRLTQSVEDGGLFAVTEIIGGLQQGHNYLWGQHNAPWKRSLSSLRNHHRPVSFRASKDAIYDKSLIKLVDIFISSPMSSSIPWVFGSSQVGVLKLNFKGSALGSHGVAGIGGRDQGKGCQHGLGFQWPNWYYRFLKG